MLLIFYEEEEASQDTRFMNDMKGSRMIFSPIPFKNIYFRYITYPI